MNAYRCDICKEFHALAFRYKMQLTRYDGNTHCDLNSMDVCPGCMAKLGLDGKRALEMLDKQTQKEQEELNK